MIRSLEENSAALTQTVSVGQVTEVLEELYPLHLAEEWDAPGLIVGNLNWAVERIHCAVDPTFETITEAIKLGADMLIVHHPLFFKAVHEVSGKSFRGEIMEMLIENHCALWVGHTNADSVNRGQGLAFVEKLALEDLGPLQVIDDPSSDSAVGLGRVGRLSTPETLNDFAHRVAAALPQTHEGIDVAGDLDAPISTVAVLPGSGDSMIDDAIAAQADVYVTSDLRHHPVTDAMQQAYFEGRQQGSSSPTIAFINTPHSSIEKLWLEVYGLQDIKSELSSRYGNQASAIEISLTNLNTNPWNLHIS